jgi:hypothetical protein
MPRTSPILRPRVENIRFHCQCFLSLGCCLLVVSGLTAGVTGAQPRRAQNDPPPRVEGARPDERTPPPIELRPNLLNAPPVEAPRLEEQDQELKTGESAFRWIVWIVSAILAILGGWGTTQAMRKKPIPPRGTPKMRREELGLGVDGKGGVWRREVFPWEQ